MPEVFKSFHSFVISSLITFLSTPYKSHELHRIGFGADADESRCKCKHLICMK